MAEVCGTNLLKLSDGFAKFSHGQCVGILSAFGHFRTLPVGILYAIWAGVAVINLLSGATH